jgi:hypothetical protein
MCLLTLLLLTVGGHTKSDAERDQKKIKEAFEKKIAEQDKKHEDTKRELEEQTVKHERAQRSAAEIEDSLRSELKRLKEEKPPDYIKMLSDTASETAQGISETAQEHYKTLKQKSGEAWEATSEFHESNVKPAVEDFVKQASDFVKPHADNIMPTVKPIAQEANNPLDRWYVKLSIFYETNRLRLVNVLASQPNITNGGAEYMVDLGAWTIFFAMAYYIIFPMVFKALSYLTCGFCCCFSRKKERRRLG